MSYFDQVITDSLLADANKIDKFTAKHANGVPSLENTLRIIKDIDPEKFRAIGRDVWGTGESGGSDRLGKAITACVGQLDKAANEASAWTGQASNAYTARIAQIKKAVNDVLKPAHDVGQALVDVADGFEFKASDLWNNIWSAVGFVIGLIGLVAGIIVGITGVGAVIGIVFGIIGLLAGAAAWWQSQKFKADEQIQKCTEASATAAKAVKSLTALRP